MQAHPTLSVLVILCFFVLGNLAAVFRRNNYNYNENNIQMEQEEVEALSDRAMSDIINYWNHMKDIHSGLKYRNTPLNIVQFSWSDCGQAADPMHIAQLSVGPDPLRLPGNITVSAQGTIKEDLVAPVQVNLEVYKKVLIWVKIPCIDNLGSCEYVDGCALSPYNNKECPPVFIQQGFPCRCPAKAGGYKLNNASLFVNPVGIPSWLEDGDYRVTARLARNGKEFGCINLAFSITK